MMAPYLMSLIFCCFIALYLAFATRIRFLPGSPTFYYNFLIYFEFWIFVLCFVFYVFILFYALFHTFDKAIFIQTRSTIELSAFEQFVVNNNFIKQLLSRHEMLETVFLETIKNQNLQKKDFSPEEWDHFYYFKNEIKKLSKMDLDLSEKTNPWYLKMEGMVTKVEKSDEIQKD